MHDRECWIVRVGRDMVEQKSKLVPRFRGLMCGEVKMICIFSCHSVIRHQF